MRKIWAVCLCMSVSLVLVASPILPASAAATGPAAITKVTAKTFKNDFDEIQNRTTGRWVKIKGSSTCLKISTHKKWAGLYATTVYKGQGKSRKYIGTIILDKAYDEDPCFASGNTRKDAAKLRKLGFYGLEPKTTYTFEVHTSGGGSHKDTLKVVKAKTA